MHWFVGILLERDSTTIWNVPVRRHKTDSQVLHADTRLEYSGGLGYYPLTRQIAHYYWLFGSVQTSAHRTLCTNVNPRKKKNRKGSSNVFNNKVQWGNPSVNQDCSRMATLALCAHCCTPPPHANMAPRSPHFQRFKIPFPLTRQRRKCNKK